MGHQGRWQIAQALHPREPEQVRQAVVSSLAFWSQAFDQDSRHGKAG